MKPETLQRYGAGERLLHWALVLSFIPLSLTGLALFHPSLFFLTNLVGGGVWSRILHPFIGVLLFILFLDLARRLWRHNVIDEGDRAWLRRWRDVLANRKADMPECGRYNGGQKVLFWGMVVSVGGLLLTGIALWRPYFAPALPVTLVRWCAVLHAFAAAGLLLGVLVHVYAAIWAKGTLAAMIRGRVSEAWARRHHGGWYRQVRSRVSED